MKKKAEISIIQKPEFDSGIIVNVLNVTINGFNHKDLMWVADAFIDCNVVDDAEYIQKTRTIVLRNWRASVDTVSVCEFLSSILDELCCTAVFV